MKRIFIQVPNNSLGSYGTGKLHKAIDLNEFEEAKYKVHHSSVQSI